MRRREPNSADDAAAQPIRCAATAGLELLEEIARGGMGAILRGRDADIGRDVAVKVLLEAHLDRPELARRFLEEGASPAGSNTPALCRSTH